MIAAALLALMLSADAGTAPADAGSAYAPKAVVLMAPTTETFDKWVTVRGAEREKLKLADKLKVNDRVLMAIALDGYELPRSRKVDITSDVVITDSTGRVVMEKASAAAAHSFDPKLQTALLLAPIGSLYYGVTDPEGVYTVKVTIWDQIRGESYKTTASFTVFR